MKPTNLIKLLLIMVAFSSMGMEGGHCGPIYCGGDDGPLAGCDESCEPEQEGDLRCCGDYRHEVVQVCDGERWITAEDCGLGEGDACMDSGYWCDRYGHDGPVCCLTW